CARDALGSGLDFW
nr:immunoglobulin heavy chain junction region [Macaca mulatta]MOX92076.1 immunoglobulin heavy chain junction region [Macaca mulatta]MOX92576.1 immunoglobulin heavy chain junction region [Macaca mulatta]MOX92612.1 immunoglobulin heavy chain junction region [Macaca mulatta]MOX93066.1 immunoglobulin heavy chain junction region [Macaca mulatta]